MTDQTSAPAGGSAIADTAPADTSEISLEDAVSIIAENRVKKDNPDSAEPAAELESELAQANADPETDPGTEEAKEADPEVEELPPIERPRSWAKELDDEWASYPRSAQEKIAAREQERDSALRRSQNEAAEIRKGAEAERIKLEQAQKEYEAKLPALLEALQRQGEFADIKTMADVKKLQSEDPFRFQAWQVYQMDAQTLEAERRQAEQRQQHQKQSERATYEREQTTKLHNLIPEMKDPAKATELRSKAVNMLVDDYGFTEGELGAIMQTDDGFKLLNDARLQKLIADGLKYAELRNAPKAIAAKPIPPVQRPGAAPMKGETASARVQALEKQFERTGSVDDAYALRMARQKRA